MSALLSVVTAVDLTVCLSVCPTSVRPFIHINEYVVMHSIRWSLPLTLSDHNPGCMATVLIKGEYLKSGAF